VTTDEQRELLARLKRLVPPGGYVGRANKTALQSQHRFYYVVRRLGISKKVMGIVAHGLRHQLANDRFEAHAGVASPVRGGDVPASPSTASNSTNGSTRMFVCEGARVARRRGAVPCELTTPPPLVARLVEAADKANETRDRTTLLPVVNGWWLGSQGFAHESRKSRAQRKTG
jgi:hypothetical protein